MFCVKVTCDYINYDETRAWCSVLVSNRSGVLKRVECEVEVGGGWVSF